MKNDFNSIIWLNIDHTFFIKSESEINFYNYVSGKGFR